MPVMQKLELFVPQKNVPKKNIIAENRVITMSDINADFLEYAKNFHAKITFL